MNEERQGVMCVGDHVAPPGLEFPVQVGWWHFRANGERHLHVVRLEAPSSVPSLLLKCPHRTLMQAQLPWNGMQLPGCPGCGSVFLFGPAMGADERLRRPSAEGFPECPPGSPSAEGGPP